MRAKETLKESHPLFRYELNYKRKLMWKLEKTFHERSWSSMNKTADIWEFSHSTKIHWLHSRTEQKNVDYFMESAFYGF